jgi:hypothetical protein
VFRPSQQQLDQHWSQRDVDFGGYRHGEFFDPRHPYYHPLPTSPPPAGNYDAGDRCACEHCRSEGWYAPSPVCRFWRAHCDVFPIGSACCDWSC